MLGMKRTAAALAVLFFTVVSVHPQQTKPKELAEFAQTFRRELKAAGIVGGSFLFLKDNKVLASEYYGSANLATAT